jgi:hypothetical protein
MSDTDQEGMSERQLEDWFADEVFSGQPRSVGEALAAADEQQAPPETPAEQEQEIAPPADQPLVVTDEPTQPAPELEEVPDAPIPVGDVEEIEEELPEEGDDENVVWAKKKYGDDPTQWARAARAQEQHISRLAAEKKEAEELAGEWYEYAQGIQQEAQQQTQMGMPLSAQEENWIEQAIANPLQSARAAAQQGNVNLYNGVIGRIAEENPLMAGQIDSQIRLEMQQLAAQQAAPEPQPSLADAMGQSIQRLGIDLATYGEPMSAKIAELGEYDPYVQAILNGDQMAREMALRAVYDLVRSTAMSTRKVRSEERDEQIRHEAELRRQAAGVVTGGPQSQTAPAPDPFMAAMEQELRDRGQWRDE